VTKCAPEKLEELCERGKKNMTETYGLLVYKPPKFQNMPKRQGIYSFGTKSSLLFVTLTGTQEGSRKLSIQGFVKITSTEIMESKSLRHGYLQSESTTAGQLDCGPMPEQYCKVGKIMRIKMHQ